MKQYSVGSIRKDAKIEGSYRPEQSIDIINEQLNELSTRLDIIKKTFEIKNERSN